VYARADIYLLDDCLSAVDQHVGRHLIDNVLGPKGLLAGKTRILATNSIPVLLEADFIALLRDGSILERGTYEQLMAMKGEVSNLIRTANNEEGEEVSTPSEENSTQVAQAVRNRRPSLVRAILKRRQTKHRKVSDNSLQSDPEGLALFAS